MKPLIEWIQIILIICVTIIFLVIAFDNDSLYGKEKAESEISAIVNPAFKYRSIYAREVHNLGMLRRANVVFGLGQPNGQTINGCGHGCVYD